MQNDWAMLLWPCRRYTRVTRTLLIVLGFSCLPYTGASAQAASAVKADLSMDLDARHKRADKARQAVRLVMKQNTIASILLALGKVVDRPVIFDDKDPRFARQISVAIDEDDMMSAFAVVLKGTGLTATLGPDGRTVVVSSVNKTMKTKNGQETGRVAGQVMDSSSGKPMRGATATIVGTSLRAVTNEQGRFLLEAVPTGEQRLSVRLFGYKAVEQTVIVPANGQVSARIVLTPVATALSGVVTTATGVQDRRAVGNDITVLNADSIMKIAPVTSVTDLLETRVPGLTVIRSSGVPGAPSRLRLRGIGGGLVPGARNSNNDPIVFVDGIRVYANQSTFRDGSLASSKGQIDEMVPSALDQIDPNSIETIEVFKGASATSQWGSDAGNGVIVITTKRGKSGTTRVNGALSAGIEQMPGQYTAPGYYRFGHKYGYVRSELCSSVRPEDDCPVVDSIVRFQALDNPAFSPFGTGTSQNASASVSGGSNVLTYALTASMMRTLGYLQMPRFYEDLYRSVYNKRAPGWMRRPTGMNQWGVNTSMVVEPKPSVRLSLSTALSVSNADRASGQELLGQLSGMYIDTFALKLTPKQSDMGQGDASLSRFVERSRSRSVTSNLAGNVDWMRWAWMPLRATLGINTINRADQVEIPYGFGFSAGDTTGRFSIGRGQSVMQSASLSTTAWQGRRISSALGVQFAGITTHDFRALADSLLPGVVEPGLFNREASQSTFASTTAGWYFEPKLNLNSRFFAAPGFRLDGGSASQGGGRRGGLMAFFPKFNFSWIAVDREQAPLAGFISMLRPRLGFGVAGVQPDPTWKLRLLEDNGQRIYGAPTDGVFLLSFGNTALRPERSREIEGGFDADLWGGRASVTVSAYTKVRIDAIQMVDLPASVYGNFMSYYTNIGTVRNTGTELTVSGRIIETDLVAWNVNASLSTNRNVVVSLYGNRRIDNADGTRIIEGYPLSGRWGRPILGYTETASGRLTVNDVALGDSAVYLGAGFPAFQLPFQTGLSLWSGAVSLSAGFEYKHGLTQINQGGSVNLINSIINNPNSSYWEQAAALMASLPSAGRCIDSVYGGQCNSTIYGMVHQVNSFRFNTLSVNYNVPQVMSARWRLPRTSIALQGSNLGLWTNYRGKDPDVNSSIRTSETVSDNGAPPRPRSWTVRITLSN